MKGLTQDMMLLLRCLLICNLLETFYCIRYGFSDKLVELRKLTNAR